MPDWLSLVAACCESASGLTELKLKSQIEAAANEPQFVAALPTLAKLACQEIEKENDQACEVLACLVSHQEAIAPVISFLSAAIVQRQCGLEYIAFVVGLTCSRVRAEWPCALDLIPLVPGLVTLLVAGARQARQSLQKRCLEALELLCSRFTCDSAATQVLACLAACLHVDPLLPVVLRTLVSVAPVPTAFPRPEFHAQAESICIDLVHLIPRPELGCAMYDAVEALVPLLTDGQRLLLEVLGQIEQGLAADRVTNLEFLLRVLDCVTAMLPDEQLTNATPRLVSIYTHPRTWACADEGVFFDVNVIMIKLARDLKLALDPFMDRVFAVLLPALAHPEGVGFSHHLEFLSALHFAGLANDHAAALTSQLISQALALDSEPAPAVEDIESCLRDQLLPSAIACLIAEMGRPLTDAEKQFHRIFSCVADLLSCDVEPSSDIARVLHHFSAKMFADPQCLTAVRAAIADAYIGFLQAHKSEPVPAEDLRTIWTFVRLLNDNAACLSDDHLLSAVGLAGYLATVSNLVHRKEAPVLLFERAWASVREDVRATAVWAKKHFYRVLDR